MSSLKSSKTATTKRGRKSNVSNAKIFLSAVNPEVFSASPRSGGIVPISLSTKQSKSANSKLADGYASSLTGFESDNETKYPKSVYSGRSYISTISNFSKPSKTGSVISRDYRLGQAIEDIDWELTALDEREAVVGTGNIYADSSYLLSVTISCVMLMASGETDIAPEYLTWAENYLNCIRNEYGEHPPNVKGILDQIYSLKNGGKKDSGVKETLTDTEVNRYF